MHTNVLKRFLSAFLVLNLCIYVTNACKGCVNLDQYNFDKITSRFKAVLVKFDVSYPYGDKHEVFVQLANDLVENKDLILAEVGVKDYGERDNEELAKKYGINGKDDLPAIRLIVDGKSIDFPSSSKWTVDELKQFLKDNTNIYIGLPGCLEQFDRLAMKFVKAADKKTILAEVEQAVNNLTDETEKAIGTIYRKFMSRIIEKGIDFVAEETTRLSNLLKGKLSSKKKMELTNKLNVLKSFKSTSNAQKTEL